MKTARLLLVDDDQDNLEVLTVLLRERFHVSSFACAQEALTALEAARPHLVLLDIGMGPVDGLQCLEAIRAMPEHGSIPAIALTAYARDAEQKAFLAAGFQAVVTKPILDPHQLFGPITALLGPPGSGRLAGDREHDQPGQGDPASDGAVLDSPSQVRA